MINPDAGMKIYVRATQCDPVVLGDADAVAKFLADVTELIGMRAMEPPTTFRVGDGEPYHSTVDVGVSGQIIWMDSGGQVHTYPELGRLHFDCESCKKFDAVKLADFTRSTFRALEVRVYDLSHVLSGRRNESEEKLKRVAMAAYKKLQRLAPDSDEAVALGMELFL